jgi:GTP-binding protein EngB required for normal cell division
MAFGMTEIRTNPQSGHEDSSSPSSEESSRMNTSQKLYLRVSCQHIDDLLSGIEEILQSAASKSPFPRYILDLSPAQIRIIEDYIRRLRTQLVRTVAWQHIDIPEPTIPATRAITTRLAFVDIALDELRPSTMRGSGSLAPDAALQLTGVVRELGALSEGLSTYMYRGLTSSLKTRFDHLAADGHQVQLLQLVEEIITSHGMVEFRPRLDTLTSRLEDNNFEVALFGRVSSGKSSLLNRLLGFALLPVGINPITAVPTRLQYGPAVRAIVSLGTGTNQEVSVQEFGELVSERGNPGNLKNVTRAVIEVPSNRLSEGIVLVDTPGLGSLAKRGATETLAYLPSCDLALLLVDAGSTLNEEDVGTLRIIEEAGIPSLVLLSKSDLLSQSDLSHATSYVREQLKRELHRDVTIHAVSAVPESTFLLDQFFQEELLPRFKRAHALRNQSVSRKVEILRQTVISTLRSRIGRQERREVRNVGDLSNLEGSLRDITGRVGELTASLDKQVMTLSQSSHSVLSQVVDQAAYSLRTAKQNTLSSVDLSEMMHAAVGSQVDPLVKAAREVGRTALARLQEVARALGRLDMPDDDKELDSLLRDMPRFEIATLPADINVGLWGSLGSSILQIQLRKKLQHAIYPLLKQELETYGHALWQWMRQFGRRLELLMSSYADGYRAQIQELSGHSTEGSDINKMKQDLELLVQWTDSGRGPKEVARQIGA